MADNIQLSAYKIYWVEFRAHKGIVTKHDARILRRYDPVNLRHGDRVHEHFASKEAALEYLRNKDFSKLGKRYEVRICTDKQFGMGHMDGRSNIIQFSSKQESEMYVIGCM